ncbi:MAG: TolC family protein, partial [Arenibacter sp.]
MYNYNYATILFVFFSLINPINAQDILRVEEAVQIALENNYQIKIAANELQIDEVSVSVGNAGMLPQVGLNLIDNNSLQYLSQT